MESLLCRVCGESVVELLQRESIEGIRDERGGEPFEREGNTESRETDVSIERASTERVRERPVRESLLRESLLRES